MQSKKNFSFYSGVDGGPGKTWLFTFFFFNLSLAGLLFQQISNILFPADVWLTLPARLVRPPARIWPASQPTSTATATSTARNYHRLPRLILMILDACLKLKKQNCFLKQSWICSSSETTLTRVRSVTKRSPAKTSTVITSAGSMEIFSVVESWIMELYHTLLLPL